MSLLKSVIGGKTFPLYPEYVSDKAEEELKNSVSAEQYRIGETLLFIPRGLRWGYVPMNRVTKSSLSRWTYQPKCCCGMMNMRLPAAALKIGEEQLNLKMNLEESAERILSSVRAAITSSKIP
ncbi:MAG: hypothetical protein J6O43_03105 [Clostridium sp.]|nr:hypothetical protein [Clostridium sp.]